MKCLRRGADAAIFAVRGRFFDTKGDSAGTKLSRFLPRAILDVASSTNSVNLRLWLGSKIRTLGSRLHYEAWQKKR